MTWSSTCRCPGGCAPELPAALALAPAQAPGALRGARLRLALEGLGPIFIKFGQLLSTRRDLLPPDIADELARLQDQVPPFDPAQAVARIEEQLGARVSEVFARFDVAPLASASVAQVHAAQLKAARKSWSR